MSQSALFAVMAVQFGGVAHALTLGLLFILGMLVSDAANGWWIFRLLDRSDRLAVVASRTMTLAMGCVSLLVAAIGAARIVLYRFDGLLQGREVAIGGSVVALVASSHILACRLVPLRAADTAQSRCDRIRSRADRVRRFSADSHQRLLEEPACAPCR